MGCRFRNIPRLTISFILLLLFTAQILASAGKSNLDIINATFETAADSLINQLLTVSADTVYSNIKTAEAERFFNNILLRKAEKKGIVFMIADIESDKKPYLELTNSIVLTYKNDKDDSDSLIRHIEFQWSGAINQKNGKMIPVNLKSSVFEDKISREEAATYNKSSYDFAKSGIPQKPSSFWKDIVQPVAIIGAAVVTVVLLFSMRSN